MIYFPRRAILEPSSLAKEVPALIEKFTFDFDKALEKN
jgi:hypothetical protein